MGNAVAPAPPTSSATPLNTLLSSTTQLDLPLPSPSLHHPPPLSESKTSPPSESHTSVDIPPTSTPTPTPTPTLSDLTPQQLLFYAADTGDCDLLRTAVERGAAINKADLGLKAQDEEKRAEEEQKGGRSKGRRNKADAKAAREREALYKDLIISHDTALHKAAARGHCAIIEQLAQLDADLEAANVLGSTPLHRAVSLRQRAAVELLLGKGARLDAANAIGNSPLHVASYQGDVEMAQLLLTQAWGRGGVGGGEAYRLVVAVNNAGLTPIDYARKKPMHSLLTSYRPAVSHTSSFVEHPNTGSNPHTTTHGGSTDPTLISPKHADGIVGLGQYVSAGGCGVEGEPPPPLPRAASGGRSLPSHRSAEHGPLSSLHHHHHAPNPPLHAQSTLLSAQSFDSSSSSASSSTCTSSFPPSHGHGGDAAEHPTLALTSMPSFEKTSSLDSHPTSRAWEGGGGGGGGEVSVVGPVDVGGAGEGGMGGMKVAGDGNGGGALAVIGLPNECETGEEEKQQPVMFNT